MSEHNELGNLGEEQVAAFLRKEGYTILERDWKFGKKDLDVIALDETGAVLVFIEVKTRRDNELTEPVEAVDLKKMKSIASCANAYVKMNRVPHELRFDIVSVIGRGKTIQRIEHIKDAFNPLLVR